MEWMTRATKGSRRRLALPLVVLAGLAATTLALAPAQAAEQYTITAGPGESASSTRVIFRESGCSPDVADSAVNGSDGLILDVAEVAGDSLTVRWNAEVNLGFGATMVAKFFTAGSGGTCKELSGRPTSAPNTTWALEVPQSAAWVVFVPNQVANVTLTVA